MKKKLIFMFVLMCFSFNAAKGVDPSCLFNISERYVNFLDAIFIDSTESGIIKSTIVFLIFGLTTLDGKPFHPDSLINNYITNAKLESRYYSNELFFISFPGFPFDTTNYDVDTVKYFTVNDIKQEKSEIKDSLLSISSITGEIRFYQTNMKFRNYTNITHMSYEFCASFENIVNAFKIEKAINHFDINYFYCYYGSYLYSLSGSVYEKNENINLYPNPADGAVFIDIKEHFSALKITNTNGSVIKEFTLEEIRNFNANQKIAFKVNELNTGVYFVIIDNMYVEKLVIVK